MHRALTRPPRPLRALRRDVPPALEPSSAARSPRSRRAASPTPRRCCRRSTRSRNGPSPPKRPRAPTRSRRPRSRSSRRMRPPWWTRMWSWLRYGSWRMPQGARYGRAPRSRRRSKPYSASTSRVCSPRRGGGVGCARRADRRADLGTRADAVAAVDRRRTRRARGAADGAAARRARATSSTQQSCCGEDARPTRRRSSSRRSRRARRASAPARRRCRRARRRSAARPIAWFSAIQNFGSSAPTAR